ncbi:MAG TPA: lipopolysaccharide assembly protein LapA domain-containing protein [Stellaceae bacterium]|jgi:uncharacterized integral membrane protein
MRFLFRLAMVVLAIVLIVFAVSNRGTIALGLWPLPDVVELPLYLIILGCLLVGFLAGELAAWASGRHWRREVRRSARRIAVLERELDAARAEHVPTSVPTRLAG